MLKKVEVLKMHIVAASSLLGFYGKEKSAFGALGKG